MNPAQPNEQPLHVTLKNPEPEPEKFDPHKAWDGIVAVIREAKLKARAGSQSPIIDPLPAPTGKYIVYAFDKNGMLSFGKPYGHGGYGGHRLKPHWNKKKLALKSLTLEIFRREYAAYEAEMRAEDAKDGKEFQGISHDEIAQIGARAAKYAVREFKKSRRASRAAIHARHRIARSINFGVIAGNMDRRAHAQG